MHLDLSTTANPLSPAGTMEEAEVVNEGWLIKSPPEKRFPRAKWRRRYFLLRRSGALPAQYVLEYFSDETKRKLKGRIELDQCEQVDAGLTLDSRKHQYDFMFDIRTPKRIFYLAAESKAMMEHWVDCICRVCGLKVYNKDGGEEGSAPPTGAPDASPLPRGPDATSEADDSDSPPVSPSSPSSVSGPYIPISECISGTPLAGGTPEPSPTTPAPAKAPVSARPFSGRRRPLARRGTDAADLPYDALRAPAAAEPAAVVSPPPQVNWETYPGQSQHTRSNSMPETVKGGVNKAEQLKQGPPRPPKPPHLQGQDAAATHNYQNFEELRSPRLSDTESATPRTPTTVPADDMFDVPRAHLERASGRRRNCYASAAPGQIFNYDFSERPPPAPVVNRTLKPRKTSEPTSAGCEPAPAAAAGCGTPGSTPGSAPPAVDRALKPARTAAAQGKVLTLAPPPVRHGAAVRHQRAAPSPTPSRAAEDKVAAPSPPTVTPFGQEQVYYYTESQGRPFHEVQYLDLDLGDSGEAGSPRSPTKAPLGREPSTGTVYKTVDFAKTEAFNKTRQSVELERTKDGPAPLSRSSVDVSRRGET